MGAEIRAEADPARFNDAVTRTPLTVTLRLVGFLLVVVAEVYLIVEIGDAFRPANHFSYFTILSNVVAALVFLVGAFRPVPDLLRGAAVVYMATTGVIYALLLRGVDVQTPALANLILHAIVPVLVVVDWLLAPPARPIPLARAAWWLVFPMVYLAYSLIRGPMVGWYPYPFLDPREHGYGYVAIMSVVVAVSILVIAALVAWVGNRLTARRAPAPA